MTHSLNSYFTLDEGLPPSTQNRLVKLRGRPLFFFNHFWEKLWGYIHHNAGLNTVDAKALIQLIDKAADAAFQQAVSSALKNLRELYEDQRMRAELSTTRALIKELYIALRMNGGHVRIKSTAMQHLIAYAFFALEPTSDLLPVDMLGDDAELVFSNALLSFGNRLVIAALEPAADPVFSLLSTRLGLRDLDTFDFSTSVKGRGLEILVAWSILRLCTRAGQGPCSLREIFNHLAAAQFELPTGLDNLQVNVQRAVSAKSTRLDGETDFHLFFRGYDDAVLYALDEMAGGDLAFCATDAHGERILVLWQVKAKQQTSLQDCLRSSHPAWQYVGETERQALTSGLRPTKTVRGSSQVIEKSAMRLVFEQLHKNNQEFFDRCIRVIFAVNQYQDKTMQMCTKLNRGLFASSPVILCCSSSQCFGKDIHLSLVDSCRTPDGKIDLVQHPSKNFGDYLWPHTVAEVGLAWESDANAGKFATSIEARNTEIQTLMKT